MKRILKGVWFTVLMTISLHLSFLMAQSSKEPSATKLETKVKYELVHSEDVISLDALFLPDDYVKLSELLQSKNLHLGEREEEDIKDFVYETKAVGKEIFTVIDQKATAKDRFYVDKCYDETRSTTNEKEREGADLNSGKLPSEEKKVESQKAEDERWYIQQMEELYQRNEELFIDLFHIMQEHDIFAIIFQGSDVSDFLGRDHGWLPIEWFIVIHRKGYFYLCRPLPYFAPSRDICPDSEICHSCFVEGDPMNYCVALVKSECKGETIIPLVYSEVYGRSEKTPPVYMKLRLVKKLPIRNEKWVAKGCSEDIVENTMPYYGGIRFAEKDVIPK